MSTQLQHLETLTRLPDPARRVSEIDRYWGQLINQRRVPLIEGDTVTFLYRGPADSVSWQGDFNDWGSDKSFINRGQRLPNTDIWYLQARFPVDARLDYKIVLNGRQWILDPANALQQWGGGGPNSVLRMPGWQPDPATAIRSHARRGHLSDSLLLCSDALNYTVSYRIYTPYGYASLRDLPVVYVTDGQEYASEQMGAMVNTLDNLIADQRIRPVIAVFLDPRDPHNPAFNRRMTELVLHDRYVAFVTRELIPLVDHHYRTAPSANNRAVLGTSLGGLNAAYFGYKASAYFRLIGIHSPAFWYRPAIYDLYEKSPRLPLRIYMGTGVINDTQEGARRMKAILQAKGYDLQYKEVNEGHSWGNWRNLIDDVLVNLFGRQ